MGEKKILPIRIAIVTVSDRSSRGERKDASGPVIREWAEKMGFSVVEERIVPDHFDLIKSTLTELCDNNAILILTTGGTGFSERDITPEATLAVVERLTPGFVEAMRMESLKITPRAMLSRAVAGIRKKTIIINLPGSPKAVAENLAVIEKAIVHGIEILHSAVSDCGSLLSR
jgi:molybdopterin adenylyltransferase